MIPRNLSSSVLQAARHYPVVTVTGPRQSGKTTLCRALFPNKPYVSLELHDVRDYATQDPRGFLAEHADGAVFDEVQHVPKLLSYLQVEVDERPTPGRFILTGSQQLALSEAISQSLAGRTAVLHLLPPGFDELQRFPSSPTDLMSTLWTGAYPAIHQRGVPASRWLADYVTTYVQRDVRQVLNVGDLTQFTTFVRLVAGRTGSMLNLSSLGADCGISHNTARAWLSVLETSFLVMRLPTWHHNLNRQLVKTPKLHFLDVGLAAHLIGIQTPDQLRHHPLRGALFETWVVTEAYKAFVHRGLTPRLAYYRDQRGLELDLIIEDGDLVRLVEMKSGETIATDFFKPIEALASYIQASGAKRAVEGVVVYGGEQAQTRSAGRVVPWREVPARLGPREAAG